VMGPCRSLRKSLRLSQTDHDRATYLLTLAGAMSRMPMKTGTAETARNGHRGASPPLALRNPRKRDSRREAACPTHRLFNRPPTSRMPRCNSRVRPLLRAQRRDLRAGRWCAVNPVPSTHFDAVGVCVKGRMGAGRGGSRSTYRTVPVVPRCEMTETG